MGGRLRFFACGSSLMSEEIYSFCRAALGVHVSHRHFIIELEIIALISSLFFEGL